MTSDAHASVSNLESSKETPTRTTKNRRSDDYTTHIRRDDIRDAINNNESSEPAT